MTTEIRNISKRQFDAFCYVRHPILELEFKEILWFEAYGRRILGCIVMDYEDAEYGYAIFGRDKRRIFRCIELPVKFYRSLEDAIKFLISAIEVHKDDIETFYEQGDEVGRIHDILEPQVDDNKIHKYFKLLINGKGFDAAKKLIQEIAYSYVDVDGNYIKDFQSTGFNARLWELYLYVYFYNSGFIINNQYHAPDYFLNYFGEECGVEAVTVNANKEFDEMPPVGPNETFKYIRDYMAIKFGSPLYSKLQKKYWLKDHMVGKPFIIAIHDFHMESTESRLGSMTWSRQALMDYLYGERIKMEEDDSGNLSPVYNEQGKMLLEKITEHTWKGKVIPSNFFSLLEAENISAVIFSNNATLATFNRMGQLAGLSEEQVKIIRHSILYNPQDKDPLIKVQDIRSPEYEESWFDSMIIYHNPNAKKPLDLNLFSNISQIYFDKKRNCIVEEMTDHHVISSQTINFINK